MRSLYIHTPFCVHKCHYCDFYSFVDRKDQQSAFIARLIRELRALAPQAHDPHGVPVPLRTIFIGGGTPSLLAVPLWEQLLKTIRSEFDLSQLVEFTVECNPESTTAELLHVLRAGGVNRVSVGCQSFNPVHLKTLERWHDPANVLRAISLAREAGVPRQSVDLIYAIPGQSLNDWSDDLRQALALGTSHISCYNLTYEPNTAMTARMHAGDFTPTDEDLEAEMFQLATTMLVARGLHRYEVSNYALPGDESQHNLAYWRQEQWLAAGPSASGHVWAAATHALGGHRWKNRPALAHYLDFDDEGFAPITGYEAPDPARALRERLMTGIRLGEGIDAHAALAHAATLNPSNAQRLHATIQELIGDGLVLADPLRWRVTDQGWLLADFIARKLMACIAD